jgi:hypothetical protein
MTRWVAMLAGTQGGKTSLGPHWLYREIYGCEEEGFEGIGAGDYLAITAVYDLFKLRMLPALQRVFCDLRRMGRYWVGDRVIELRDPETGQFHASRATDRMWGRVILRSADSPGGLESGTIKAAWLDEAGQDRFQVGAWRAIRRRLSLQEGRALLTTTLYNLGWVKTTFMDPVIGDRGEAKEGTEVQVETTEKGAECQTSVNVEKDITLVQFDSIANPEFSVKEFDAARGSMPDDEFMLFYRGRSAKLRSLIYDCFNSDVHKIGSFKIPMTWPVVVGVDPIGDRIAALWIAFDVEHSRLHVFQEYAVSFGVTTSTAAEEIKRMGKGYRVIMYVGGGPSERQQRLDLRGHGLPVIAPEITAVQVGIDKVYELFKTYAMVVHDGCEGVLDELGGYQRVRDRDGEITDKIKDKSKYNLLDCLRYGIIGYLYLPGTTEVLYRPGRIEL